MPFRLYVRGVDGTLTLKGPQLADLFAKYGKVLQIQTGEQGFAFVVRVLFGVRVNFKFCEK